MDKKSCDNCDHQFVCGVKHQMEPVLAEAKTYAPFGNEVASNMNERLAEQCEEWKPKKN